jgi:hypothetical protein
MKAINIELVEIKLNPNFVNNGSAAPLEKLFPQINF